jgi:hypothetical protein
MDDLSSRNIMKPPKNKIHLQRQQHHELQSKKKLLRRQTANKPVRKCWL